MAPLAIAFDTVSVAHHIRPTHFKGRLVSKPGVTQELRTRATAHLAAQARQRRLVAVAVALAVVAVCAYLVLRWLA